MASRELQIYFAGAIRGGRQDAELYAALIGHLGQFGRVLTEHVGNAALLRQEQSMSEAEIFARDMLWLRAADLMVAEVTTPSLGVGYEIAMAQLLGKEILCLCRARGTGELSAMIAGNPELRLAHYTTDSEAAALIDQFIDSTINYRTRKKSGVPLKMAKQKV